MTSLALFMSLILIGCTQDSTDSTTKDATGSKDTAQAENNSADKTPGQPYLRMSIVDYPSTINNWCQNVTFTIEVTNTGDTALAYSDLADSYYFNIMSDDAISHLDGESIFGLVDTSHDDYDDTGLIDYTRIISDFGTIDPGETATITFTSSNYVVQDQHEYFWINSFNNLINGNFHYYIDFGKISTNGIAYSLPISSSPAVTITTALFDADGGGNYCELQVITDETIDFYKDLDL